MIVTNVSFGAGTRRRHHDEHGMAGGSIDHGSQASGFAGAGGATRAAVGHPQSPPPCCVRAP
jgi:hypothetical protein